MKERARNHNKRKNNHARLNQEKNIKKRYDKCGLKWKSMGYHKLNKRRLEDLEYEQEMQKQKQNENITVDSNSSGSLSDKVKLRIETNNFSEETRSRTMTECSGRDHIEEEGEVS